MISEDGLVLHTADAEGSISCSDEVRDWLCQLLEMARPSDVALSVDDALQNVPGEFEAMTEAWAELRELGLLVV